ncbi:MAG: VWA domain-containing protein, partial [Taibaiella sp.]|nr:VWA domain-containing protein [Taibaiella sp.]
MSACPAMGQAAKGFTQSRILILLDESSSMLQRWAGGREKNKIANELVLKLMDSVWTFNDQVEFSLRVFGSQSTVPEHNCTDTRNEVPFTKQNRTQMEFRLDDIKPLGVTSIAYSLSEAAEKDLIDEEHNAYSIVLITDGGESCGGDICGVMAKLLRRKIFFKPYIISLEAVPELKNEYSCMGNYLQVTQKADLPVAVGAIVEAFRPMLNISKEDYKILQRVGAPSVLKVNLPSVKTEK